MRTRLMGLLLIASTSLLSCSGDDRSDASTDETDSAPRDITRPDRGADEIGRLVPLVGGGQVNTNVLEGESSLPPGVDVRAISDMVAAPDGGLWILVPVGSADGAGVEASLLRIVDNRVDTIDVPVPVLAASLMGAGPDDAVYLISAAGELLRLHGGDVHPTGYGGAASPSRPAGAPDGTVYVINAENDHIDAVDSRGGVHAVVADAAVAQMAVGPDGTLYYQERDTGGIRAMTPSGERRDVAGFGDAEPRDGGSALDASLGVADMAVNEDGLHVLFGNEVWRIDGDGQLHLVLRRRWHPPPRARGERGPDDNEVQLYDIAAGRHEIYVWDAYDGTVYRVEPHD